MLCLFLCFVFLHCSAPVPAPPSASPHAASAHVIPPAEFLLLNCCCRCLTPQFWRGHLAALDRSAAPRCLLSSGTAPANATTRTQDTQSNVEWEFGLKAADHRWASNHNGRPAQQPKASTRPPFVHALHILCAAHLHPLPLARHFLYCCLDCCQRVVHALLLALRRPRHLDRQTAAACSTRVWATTDRRQLSSQKYKNKNGRSEQRDSSMLPAPTPGSGAHQACMPLCLPTSPCQAHPPDQKRYVASHALRICAAQSLPVSRTGTGCFFYLKKDLPAGSEAGRHRHTQQGAMSASQC